MKVDSNGRHFGPARVLIKSQAEIIFGDNK